MKKAFLLALAAVMIVALAGAHGTPAGAAALCDVEPPQGVCPKGRLVTHLHGTSVGKAMLSTRIFSVRCEALFAGDISSSAGSGALAWIEGEFSYSDCSGDCVLTEESLPVEIAIRALGDRRTTDLIPYALEHVNCAGFVNCTFKERALRGSGKSPSAGIRPNGEIAFAGQRMRKESGALCLDDGGKLDIVIEPLRPVYVAG